MVNPGEIPDDFGLMMVHTPGAGPSAVSGPRTASSIDNEWPRIRFVNQLESGTSSIVFTF